MNLEQQHSVLVHQIREFSPSSILDLGICLLQESTGDPGRSISEIQEMRKRIPDPWIIMLLIRWALQYRKEEYSLSRISLDEFHILCDNIISLHETEDLKESNSELQQFGVIMRYFNQQVVYQNYGNEVEVSLARQFIWYYQMDKDGFIRDLFFDATSVPLRNFLGLYLWCYCHIDLKEFDLSRGMLAQHIKHPAGVVVADRFLSALSMNSSEARKYLKKHTAKHTGKVPSDGIGFQILEPTPLERFPFFADGKLYRTYSPALLAHGMRHNVYRILVEQGHAKFGAKFGCIFEKYVGWGLNYCCDSVMNEKQIERAGMKDMVHADFFVREGGSAIFVDAKSTELSLIPRVLQTKESILKNTKGTLIKGMQQIVSTCDHFLSNSIIGSDDDLFGLVVTHGNYCLTWERLCGFAEKEIRDSLAEVGGADIIDRIRFLFVDIESFDYLVAVVKKHNLRMADVLSYVAEQNKCPQTELIYFKLHLKNRWGYCFPTYIRDMLQEIGVIFDDSD